MNCSDESSNCQLWLIAVLTSLLLMCGGLGLFFFHQASLMKGQVVQCGRIIAEYDSNSVAKVNGFVAGLQALSRNNPDLLPILAKYNLQPGAQQSPIAPASKK
jgi:hypothetical protein